MKKRSVSRRAVRRQTFSCRPHYEVLEARLPLGDVLLGTLWASSLAGASMASGERDLVDDGLSVLVSEDLALTSVEWNSNARPRVVLRAAGIDVGQTGDASGNLPPTDLVAAPMVAMAPVRAMGSLPAWHAFAASSNWLTEPDQGGAKAWHPTVAQPEPAPPPSTGSQALPGNRLPQSSASSPRGGASRAVRSQAEPGNEVVEAAERYGNMPLAFEANHGQTDARVDFIARTGGATVFLTPTEAVFSFPHPSDDDVDVGCVKSSQTHRDVVSPVRLRGLDTPYQENQCPPRMSEPRPLESGLAPLANSRGSEQALHMQIVGGHPNATPVGQQQLPGIVNYFIGNDPSQWHANIPTFGRVEYQDVYPGIDLAYYGTQHSVLSTQHLEYDFIVSPGADPNAIALKFANADALEVNPQGDLIIHTAAGELVQQKPYLYQDVNGTRQEVPGEFRIQNSESSGSTDYCLLTTDYCSVTFDVGAYDAGRPLVIDPLVLGYSTYLGGGELELAIGIAVDNNGHAYVAGETRSLNFPATDDAFDETYSGGTSDAFVAKLNDDGSALVYATYLGGAGGDKAGGIAVDADGNAFVTGNTFSTDFPTTPGAFDESHNSGNFPLTDAFVIKLAPDGSALIYSTFLGGRKSDGGGSIALAADGSVYVLGGTSSRNFPVTPGGFDSSYNGGGDPFVAKLDPAGGALIFATYLGGTDSDAGFGLAVDTGGSVYVTGLTESMDFPATPGAFDESYNTNSDGYVAKLTADGSRLAYSTYLGGDKGDQADDIAVDDEGNAYVAGITQSVNFPVTAGAYDTMHFVSDGNDGFATKVNSSGSGLVYSTFLSGGSDSANAIGLDSAGYTYVTGTASSGFDTTSDAYDKTHNNSGDAFFMKLNVAGSALVYSTYLGGTSTDISRGIALDGPGNAYIIGETYSNDFPTTPNALKRRNRGDKGDGFVTKFSEI